MICMKNIRFLVAREQKLGARGHWALLAHSPGPPQYLTHWIVTYPVDITI